MKKPSKNNSHLTAQDIEIWQKITKTARPLATGKKNIFNSYIDNNATKPRQDISQPSIKKLQNSVSPVYQAPPTVKPKPVASVMGYEMTRKIQKGKISIDGRIDLHGLTQKEAWQILYERIENAYYSGEKVILVITGKGNMGRGILREQVPLWLSSAAFRMLVSEYGTSHISHGGTGALYVRIRKRRPN